MSIRSAAEVEIVQAILENCKTFLRKAAEEIVGHDDAKDEPFSASTVVVVIVLLQTAIELATVALIMRKDGIAAVLRGEPPGDDEALRKQWLEGDLNTLSFSQLKTKAHARADLPLIFSSTRS
jgi:hypothetical protein